MHWNKVTLLGVGLLGGSLGMALKKRCLAKRIVGFVRREQTIAECRRKRAVDEATLDLQAAIKDADLIILCTPLAQMRDLLERALPGIGKGTIITDVGSVKGVLVRELEPMARKAGAHFIGSHPMAGGEKMGVSAARADLFQGAACVITPTAKSSQSALAKVEQLWRDVGAQPMRMTPKLHDELVARSSHLPHLLAASLAQHVLDPRHGKEQGRLCAGGFRDTTRIASSSPEMWRDIALMNRANLLRELNKFEKQLAQLRRALGKPDGKAMEQFFASAKARRDEWGRQAAATSTE